MEYSLLKKVHVTCVAIAYALLFGRGVLSYGRSKRMRLAAWVLAQVIFGYIVLVAFTRSVMPVFLG
jgi:uncharacterized membrane protein SirB2